MSFDVGPVCRSMNKIWKVGINVIQSKLSLRLSSLDPAVNTSCHTHGTATLERRLQWQQCFVPCWLGCRRFAILRVVGRTASMQVISIHHPMRKTNNDQRTGLKHGPRSIRPFTLCLRFSHPLTPSLQNTLLSHAPFMSKQSL